MVSTGALAVAGAVITVMMLASGPTSSAASISVPQFPAYATTATPATSPPPTMADDMPGMDHGSGGTPTRSPSPTTAGDSPWKTHDDSGTPAHSHGSGGMPGMDHGAPAAVAKDRPLAPVLGTFGGGTSAVLLSAVFLRRRDRARARAKQAARASRLARK